MKGKIRLSDLDKVKSQSDVDRVLNMSEEEKVANAIKDQDAQPPTEQELKEFKRVEGDDE